MYKNTSKIGNNDKFQLNYLTVETNVKMFYLKHSFILFAVFLTPS